MARENLLQRLQNKGITLACTQRFPSSRLFICISRSLPFLVPFVRRTNPLSPTTFSVSRDREVSVEYSLSFSKEAGPWLVARLTKRKMLGSEMQMLATEISHVNQYIVVTNAPGTVSCSARIDVARMEREDLQVMSSSRAFPALATDMSLPTVKMITL